MKKLILTIKKIMLIIGIIIFATSCSSDKFTNLKATLSAKKQKVKVTEGKTIVVDLDLSESVTKNIALIATIDTDDIASKTNGYLDYEKMRYSTNGGSSWIEVGDDNKVIFGSGTTSLKLEIRTKDDELLEPSESFNVNISLDQVDSALSITKYKGFDKISCTIEDNGKKALTASEKKDGVLIRILINDDKTYSIAGVNDKVTDETAKKIRDSKSELDKIMKDVIAMISLAGVKVTIFQIIYSTNNTGGYVTPLDKVKNEWLMGMNLYLAYNARRTGVKQEYNANGNYGYIMTHELGHLLTLNYKTQINPPIAGETCTTWFQGDGFDTGCSNPNSHINLFRNMFYNTDNKTTKSGLVTPAHVTTYATTNLAEDIAETFAYYIVQKKTPASKTDSSTALNKINFIGGEKELADLKTKINTIFDNLNVTSSGEKEVFKYQENISCLAYGHHAIHGTK